MGDIQEEKLTSLALRKAVIYQLKPLFAYVLLGRLMANPMREKTDGVSRCEGTPSVFFMLSFNW
jgi:hypothetical protein